MSYEPWIGLVVAVVAIAEPQTARTEVAPRCESASHDRLQVQKGRDVCAASRSASGAPRAPGYLPTRCPEEAPVLQVDARGERDNCVAHPAGAQS